MENSQNRPNCKCDIIMKTWKFLNTKNVAEFIGKVFGKAYTLSKGIL